MRGRVTQRSNVNMVTQFIPPVAAVTTTIARALRSVDEAVQKTMPPVEIMSRALASAEISLQVAFNAAGPVGAVDIATDVARKNGAAISRGGYALFATNAVDWVQFAETYTSSTRPTGTSGDGRKCLRAVALNSRGGFTQERAWEMKFPLGVGKLDKQGGIDLVNYDAWKGLDSVAMCTGIPGKCGKWAPVGWGGAQAYAGRRRAAGIGIHGNDSDWNRIDGRPARTQANAVKQRKQLPSPFPDYRDLQELSTATRQKIPFAVEVLIADRDVPTARSAFGARAALTDGTAIEHDPQYSGAGSGVCGLAEACVAFERPAGAERADGGTERPSLFNPYWRAFLATPSRRTRAEVGVFKGLPPLDAIFGGAGSCT